MSQLWCPQSQERKEVIATFGPSGESFGTPKSSSRKKSTGCFTQVVVFGLIGLFGFIVLIWVMGFYLVDREQQEADQRRKLGGAKFAEVERQRIASLTPEQRAVEERQKREKAAAAAKEAARIGAEKAQALANEKKRDTQLQIAVLGARTLKRAMKDPEAFELKSLLVMPNGIACYEYRAKNSFGAILPSSAVLTTSGKMLLQEKNDNAFVGVWNKNCTLSGGTQLAPLIDQKRLLN